MEGKKAGGNEKSVFHLMGRKSGPDCVCRMAFYGSAAFTVLQIEDWESVNPEDTL